MKPVKAINQFQTVKSLNRIQLLLNLNNEHDQLKWRSLTITTNKVINIKQ